MLSNELLYRNMMHNKGKNNVEMNLVQDTLRYDSRKGGDRWGQMSGDKGLHTYRGCN